ncbi:MAG: DUF5615 family PIN-like protein [Xenococcaceae cyanobacterium]
MIRLYADEQFPFPVVDRLRVMGYDVLTVRDAKQDNKQIPDDEVLKFATAVQRAVITQNRKDFIRLHNRQPNHAGIIVCTKNLNWDSFATEINRALTGKESIVGELIRVNRPFK